jgi:hypothetical protein
MGLLARTDRLFVVGAMMAGGRGGSGESPMGTSIERKHAVNLLGLRRQVDLLGHLLYHYGNDLRGVAVTIKWLS